LSIGALFHWSPLLSFTDPPPPHLYPLSLHDALPIYQVAALAGGVQRPLQRPGVVGPAVPGRAERPDVQERRRRHIRAGAVPPGQDRKSTRLNSSHVSISYAVFCLKKKKDKNRTSKWN